MAHLYNPYATDQQSSAQAQSDPQRTSHPYPGSSYRSAPSADLYSSRAREESLHLPRSYAMTPPSQGQRQAAAESSDRSLDWPPTYKSTNEDDASKYYTSMTSSIFSGGGESRTSAVSSSFPGGGGSRFTTIGERKPHEQSIPGLGEYEFPVRETASTQPEFSRPSSELVRDVLLHFGLEKDDLEQLISYPEDQITPQNLPFILRQIRQQKTKNPVNAVKVAPHPEPKPTISVSNTDFGGRMREVPHQDYRPRGILKTSKVIDYGHINQFSAGPGEEVAMTSGAHSVGSSTLLMDSSGREAKGMNISSLISSCDQESSVPGLDPSFCFTLSSASLSTSNLPKQFPPPPKQVPQTASVPFTIPKTDTDSRVLPGVSKSFSLKGPEQSQLKSSKPCSSDTTSPSVAPGRRGLVLYDSFNDPGRPLKQVPKVPEQKQKNQQHQQPVKQEGKKKQPAAQRNPTPQVDTASSVPAPAQMCDYAAITPGMFPHSCSLCHTECYSLKEWINHQNTGLHIENCKRLRTRFPEWDGELLTSLSSSDVYTRSSTTRPSQSRYKRRNSSSRSRSRSYSPQRHRGSGSRRDQERSRYRTRSRSRSNSPRHSSRRTRRSRSRSQSPLYRSTASRYRSRSRSYERRSSPRRRDDRRSLANRSRSGERRSSKKSSAPKLSKEAAADWKQKTDLTTGEMMEENLLLERIPCVRRKNVFSPGFASQNRRVLQITNLPKYEGGSYTERDVADLLTPFKKRPVVLPTPSMGRPEVPTSSEKCPGGEKSSKESPEGPTPSTPHHSCTTTARHKSLSRQRRSHCDVKKSRSLERRFPRCRDKSRSPNQRPHHSRDKSLSPEGKPKFDTSSSLTAKRRSHRGKDKLRSPEHRSNPVRDESLSIECKEKSSSSECNSQPGKDRSLNTESRSEQEHSSNSRLAALSAENTAAEPERETPVEETSVTQSLKSEDKQEEMNGYQNQLPGPGEDPSLDGLSLQVLDSIGAERMADGEESGETQTDTSFQVLDSVVEDQSATDHVTEVAAAENVKDETRVSNIAKRPRRGRGGKTGRKPKVLTANKDTTDQIHFEVIESVQSPTETEDPEPTSQAPKDVTLELEPIKEEEVFQVIDLVAEQFVCNYKKKQGHRGRQTRRSVRGRTSEGESEEKQDETQTKSEATKPDSITNKEGADEVPCLVLDSIGSETIQETEKVVRRRSTRGNKEEKRVNDSVENDGTPEEVVKVARSTRVRRGQFAKMDISTRGQTAAKECEEGKETSLKAEETLVSVEEVAYKVTDSVADEGAPFAPPVSGRKRKRGRRRNVKATSKPAASKKTKVEIEEEPTYQINDSVEEEVAEDQEISNEPGTAEESSTPGENDDKQKITESVCEEDEEEPVYQIVDSGEGDQEQEETEDDPVPDNKIPGTIKGSTEGQEEQKDYTNLTEDKNHESSTMGSAHVILDKEAKELEMNNEEPGSLSMSIEECRSKEKETTAFEPMELLTLDEVSADEAPEGWNSVKKEEMDKEEPRSRSCSIEARRRKEIEMSKVDIQELLTLDEVGADDAIDDSSDRKEELKMEADLRSRSSGEGPMRKEVEMDQIDTEQPEAEGPEPKEELSIHDKGKDRPISESNQSLDPLKSESLAAVDGEKDDDLRHDDDITVVGKLRKELMEPEAKRSRSQSPDVPADFTLLTYSPGNPLGVEFVVPKAGFFCNICSIFYVDENTAKEVHCSSRRHFDNLKKHYLKLTATPSRASSPTSSNVSSDGV